MGWEKKANQIRYKAAAFTISMMVISLARDDQRGLGRAPGAGMSQVSWPTPGITASAGCDRDFPGRLESLAFNPM